MTFFSSLVMGSPIFEPTCTVDVAMLTPPLGEAPRTGCLARIIAAGSDRPLTRH